MSFVKTFVALLCLGTIVPGQAETLLLDDIDAGRAQGTAAPSRGMSMEGVETRFGAPTNRRPAVGEPPITRWEYPDFTVYFEHQFVIHAVRKR